jgi:uncharacterized protein YggU (UPF0235/DUF167 family)
VTRFWRATADGVTLMMKVQPKSRRPGLQGVAPGADGERLRLGVTEAAEGGRANDAVRALIADILHLPRSAVTIIAGATSREKTVRVLGDPAALADRLAAL